MAQRLLAADLERFQVFLERSLEPQEEYLSETEHELYQRGKKLRPLMLLLSGHLVASRDGQAAELTDKVIQAAVSVEMLHVATLIHDDIVDEAPMRRGLRSVHADRGTEMAVLIGDLQFIQAVRGFAGMVETDTDIALVQIVLDTGFNICCGELDEIRTDPNWHSEVLRNRYFRTIDRKTAMLFGLACEAGATLMGASKRGCYFVSRYGRAFGRAFQIMDDLLDCVRGASEAGKLPGTDLAQGRLTLPIIYAMDELPKDHIVQRVVRKETADEADLRLALDAVISCDGFLRAYSEAREAVARCMNYLEPFPESPYRQVMVALAEEIIDRPISTVSF